MDTIPSVLDMIPVYLLWRPACASEQERIGCRDMQYIILSHNMYITGRQYKLYEKLEFECRLPVGIFARQLELFKY